MNLQHTFHRALESFRLWALNTQQCLKRKIPGQGHSLDASLRFGPSSFHCLPDHIVVSPISNFRYSQYKTLCLTAHFHLFRAVSSFLSMLEWHLWRTDKISKSMKLQSLSLSKTVLQLICQKLVRTLVYFYGLELQTVLSVSHFCTISIHADN